VTKDDIDSHGRWAASLPNSYTIKLLTCKAEAIHTSATLLCSRLLYYPRTAALGIPKHMSSHPPENGGIPASAYSVETRTRFEHIKSRAIKMYLLYRYPTTLLDPWRVQRAHSVFFSVTVITS